jgi:hypothetical protein
VKDWKMFYQGNVPPPTHAEVTIFTSDKVNFKLKLFNRDKDHFILIRGAIHQKEITFINLYAPNVIKQTLKDLKTRIFTNTVIVGDFNVPLSTLDRSSRQKINTQILELNDTIDLMELADVYRVFHPAKHHIHSSQQSMELYPK